MEIKTKYIYIYHILLLVSIKKKRFIYFIISKFNKKKKEIIYTLSFWNSNLINTNYNNTTIIKSKTFNFLFM